MTDREPIDLLGRLAAVLDAAREQRRINSTIAARQVDPNNQAAQDWATSREGTEHE